MASKEPLPIGPKFGLCEPTRSPCKSHRYPGREDRSFMNGLRVHTGDDFVHQEAGNTFAPASLSVLAK